MSGHASGLFETQCSQERRQERRPERRQERGAAPVVSAVLAVVLFGGVAEAQTATYRLHRESSSLTNVRRLRPSTPDSASAVIRSSNLRNIALGTNVLIEDFVTDTGVPGVAGTLPAGSVFGVTVYMRKTADQRTVLPRFEVRLNSASGTLLCQAVGVDGLTTSTQLAGPGSMQYTLPCITGSAVSLLPADRVFLWAGVRVLGAAGSAAVHAELAIEGTAPTLYDAFLTVPLPVPTITGLSPIAGPPGSSVRIEGMNFGTTTGSVTFNGAPLTPVSWLSNVIAVVVPPVATTGPFVVTVGGKSSNAMTFTVAPSISGLSPTSGRAGSVVAIAGANFGVTQGSSTVAFNGTPATPTYWSATSITVPVPAGATSGYVTVTVGGQVSNGAFFAPIHGPAILSLSSAAGTVGAEVTLTGTGFGVSQGGSTVAFNGALATPTAWSDTDITVTVPVGASTGDVTVTRDGEVSNGAAFTVSYPDDTTGPTVTMSYQPQPNAAGWSRGPTLVSFTCVDAGSGVQTCPSPVTFASAGAGQSMTVTATDLAGNQTTTTATANVDLSAPVVTIESPVAGATIEATTTTVTATVSDDASGVQSASCNGVSTAFTGGTVTCVVVLGKGRTPLIVRAVDTAGRERSASILVSRVGSPTSIVVTPSRYTLSVAERRALSALDDFGRPVQGAEWSTSDALVASVDSEGLVTALGVGDAVVTVVSGALTTTVPVTVLEGPLPAGTTQWLIDPTPGWNPIQVTAVDALSAAFVMPEVQYDASFRVTAAQLRAFDDDGRQVSLVSVPLASGQAPLQVMGDAAGGIVMTLRSVGSGTTGGVVCLPVADDDSVSWISGIVFDGPPAQGSDATIVGVAKVRPTTNDGPFGIRVGGQGIVGINGLTGEQRFDVLPSRPTTYDCDPFFGEPRFYVSRFMGHTTIDTEGYAHVLGVVQERHPDLSPPSETCNSDGIYSAARVVLYRVAPSGATVITDLHHYVSLDGFTFPAFSQYPQALPDDRGGVLTRWEVCLASPDLGGFQDCHTYARHVRDGITGVEYELPRVRGNMISGAGAVGYGTDGNLDPFQFDLTTGALLWTGTAPGDPVAVLNDARVEVLGAAGRRIIDPSGLVPDSAPVVKPWVQTAEGTRIGNLPEAMVGSIVGEGFMPDQLAYATVLGGLQNRSAAPGPYGIWAKSYWAGGGRQHIGLHLVPSPDSALNDATTTFYANEVGTFNYRFAAIGGEPRSSMACLPWGSLHAVVNRPGDRSAAVSTSLGDLRERVRYPSHQADYLMQQLLRFRSYYRNNLCYELIPGATDNAYNSNSLARGLLRTAGIGGPRFADVNTNGLFPGWEKPVPLSAFEAP